MKISLRIKGEKKDFTVGFLNMLTVRRAMEIQENVENFKNPSTKELDKIVDFIVDTFDGQFTRDEYYQGSPAKGFVNRTIGVLNDITDMLIQTADEMGE